MSLYAQTQPKLCGLAWRTTEISEHGTKEAGDGSWCLSRAWHTVGAQQSSAVGMVAAGVAAATEEANHLCTPSRSPVPKGGSAFSCSHCNIHTYSLGSERMCVTCISTGMRMTSCVSQWLHVSHKCITASPPPVCQLFLCIGNFSGINKRLSGSPGWGSFCLF